jgi:DNA-binding response OmpR family regulator
VEAVGAHWIEDVIRLQPVMVVTPHRAEANLVVEQLRGFASTISTLWVQTAETALAGAASRSPGIIFVEQAGLPFEGLAFVRALRRSDLPCREAAVIMMTSQPTLRAMREAQNAGAHEFLVRPFSAYQLAKRLEAVAAPRPWVETASYIGPDRRRFNSAALLGPDRRRGAGAHRRRPEQAAS